MNNDRFIRPDMKIICSICNLYIVKDIIILYLDNISIDRYINYLIYMNNNISYKIIKNYIDRIDFYNKLYIDRDRYWKMENLNCIEARFMLFKLNKEQRYILWRIIKENLNLKMLEFPPKKLM